MPRYFDQLLEQLGHFGRYQKIVFVLVGILWIACSFQPMMIVFVGAEVRFRCRSTVNESVVTDLAGNSSEWPSSCNKSDVCSDIEYDKSVFVSTIRSKWDLVCEHDFLVALTQSVFMLGWMVGVIVTGYLADKYGRHIVIMACLLVLTALSSVAAFVTDYIAYIILRALVGAAVGGVLTSSYVLVVELVGVTKRALIGITGMVFWSLGIALLPGIAYFVRDDSYLQLTASLSCVVFLSYFWLLQESPRWLLTVNRIDKAEVIIKKIARTNGRQLDLDIHPLNDEKIATAESLPDASYLDLVKTPHMRRVTCIMCFHWFAISFVYYGLLLSGASLGVNLYLNLFLSGLVEIPALLITPFILEKMGRVRILGALTIFGGLSCMIVALLMKDVLRLNWLMVTFAMVGKMAVTSAFALVFLYTSEVYATVLRNAGLGACSMWARVGGLMAPQVSRLGFIWKLLPFMVFAVTTIVAGSLVFLLPETQGKTLPETLEDGERFAANAAIFCRCKKKDNSANHRENGQVLMNEPNT